MTEPITNSVLVTGANGYVGSRVTETLLDFGVSVTAIGRPGSNRAFIDKRAKYVPYDCLSSTPDAYSVLGCPDTCIHLAWRNGFSHNASSHITDFSHHYEFLMALVRGGLKHLVVMGSMHEVGYAEGAINEFSPVEPLSLYGISKNSLRQALNVSLRDSDCIFQWLRGFYIVGDDERNHSVFTKILESASEGKKTFPFTSGVNRYDFIDVHDLALEIALTSMQDEVSGIINCCSGKPVSLKDKVEEFIEVNHLDISLEYGAFPDRPYDSPEIYGETKKIRAIVDNAMKNHPTGLMSLRIEQLHNLLGASCA